MPKGYLTELLGPLRQYWRECNRLDREAAERSRQEQKVRDKRRTKCRCKAYPWPHRPAGGLCRFPDPPIERYQRKPGGRPYAKRYAGLRREIARANSLHPIKDRAEIDRLMPSVLGMAKQIKARKPRIKFRNMKITADGGLQGFFQTAGPMM